MRTASHSMLGLRGAVAACALVAVAGCTRVLPPSTSVDVGIVNDTTIVVGLFVNGRHIADYPPSSKPAPSIDIATLPARPWAVEARSPSGRVLMSLSVEPGHPSEGAMTARSVGLACGYLELWVGEFHQVNEPPRPTAEHPDPCD